MNGISVQILTYNNEKTIIQTVESVEPIASEIIVLDHGSTDQTLELVNGKATILTVGNRSEARNKAISDSSYDWHLLLEPWECLSAGHSSLIKASDGQPEAYRLFVSQEDILTKPVRFWHRSVGMSFEGLVFESMEPNKPAIAANAFIKAKTVDHTKYQAELLLQWRKQSPVDAPPYYYSAMIHLAKLQYDEFIRMADHFLFLSKKMSPSVLMTRFYLAMVYCYVKRKPHETLKNLLVCLAHRPMMAEFWCLLGDIHYFLLYDFSKAIRFYEDALAVGTKRKTGDEWPVQLRKYGEYPKKMIESCKNAMASRRII